MDSNLTPMFSVIVAAGVAAALKGKSGWVRWGAAVLWIDARPEEQYAKARVPGAMRLDEDDWNTLLPAVLAATPVVSNVVNLKVQYGLDTNGDRQVDTWQAATGTWSAANLPTQPAAAWQQIQAVRVAIVTRSEKYETDVITPGPLGMFCSPAPCEVSMTLTSDQQHYRYKVLESIVPLRNALWNAP